MIADTLEGFNEKRLRAIVRAPATMPAWRRAARRVLQARGAEREVMPAEEAKRFRVRRPRLPRMDRLFEFLSAKHLASIWREG